MPERAWMPAALAPAEPLFAGVPVLPWPTGTVAAMVAARRIGPTGRA